MHCEMHLTHEMENRFLVCGRRVENQKEKK